MKKTELAASGISAPEQDELDVLLENIAERERDAIAKGSEKKGQKKATAEDIRNQALERMGQTKKRKSEGGKEPKEIVRGPESETLPPLGDFCRHVSFQSFAQWYLKNACLHLIGWWVWLSSNIPFLSKESQVTHTKR